MRKFFTFLKEFGICVLIVATIMNFIDVCKLQVDVVKLQKAASPPAQNPITDKYPLVFKSDTDNYYYRLPDEPKYWSKKFDGGNVIKCKRVDGGNYDCVWKKEK